MRETRGERLFAQRAQFFVGISEPAGGRRVARIAVAFEQRTTMLLAGRAIAQEIERFITRDAVGEVAKIDASHELFRCHVRDELPYGLALGLRPQIPYRIYARADRKMHGALVRPYPAQLAVGGEETPE